MSGVRMFRMNFEFAKRSLSLLPKDTKKKMIFLIAFQVVASSIDIVALLLLGVITNVGLKYVQDELAEFPNFLLSSLNISSLNFESQFALLCLLTLLLFGARTLISILGSRHILLFLGVRGAIASNQFLDKLLQTKPDYIGKKNSQELLYGITTGIDNLVLNYLGAFSLLVSEMVFLSMLMTTVISIQPLTGLYSLFLFTITFVIINKSTSHRGSRYYEELGQLQITYNQKLLELLSVYRELLLRNMTNSSTEVIHDKRRQTLMVRARILFLPVLSKYLFEFVLLFGGALIATAQLLISDVISAVAALVIFLAASSRILPALIRAQAAALAMKQSEGASQVTAKQIVEFQNSSIVSKEDLDQIPDKNFTPSVVLSKVNFKYSQDSEFQIHDISLEIEPNSFVAIVGESGSGKSTLADIILGLIEPNTGKVAISGLNPLDAYKRWPGKVAYVPQDISIIDATIRENITLNNFDLSSDSEVYQALESAKLLDEIGSLPKKLDEVVGEKGLKLSGGQRQRLGIARALFTKPNLIVFDEATSALDPVTEKALTEAIYNRSKGVTLIVIAHRLSTVRNADLVVLLDKGQLIAQGTFEEVRKLAPSFDEQAKLVNL
jgi:ATP-binding cassette, subfamily B, bacterial PglK